MTSMDSMMDRLKRSVAQRGVIGTAQLCAKSVLEQIAPSARRAEAMRRRIDAEFDARYGVDTGGIFRPKPEEVVGNNWALGGNYMGIDPSLFREAMGHVTVDESQYAFIDFGSGKGRMLLLASQRPFRRVIGVEYCEELNRVARENIRKFPASERQCAEIEAVTADAAEFPIPDGPLLIFLYHPFAEPVMQRVAENVTASYRKCPRNMVIIYLYPYYAHLWDATGIFRKRGENPIVYEAGPVAAESRPDSNGTLARSE